MRSTARVVKVSAILLVFAVFVAGGMAAQAGPQLQATSAATMSATMSATTSATMSGTTSAATTTSGGASGASVNATAAATSSAGGTTGTSPVFAMCPPVTSVATPAANTSTGASTSATAQASNTTGTGPGYLGVQAAANDSCGVVVMQVFQNSPAMTAGLQVGDIIVAINCQPLTAMFAMNTPGGTTGTNSSANGTTGTNSNTAATAAAATQAAMAAPTDCSSAAGGASGTNAGTSATASAATQTAGGAAGSSANQPVSAFVVVSSFFRAIESNPPGTQLLLTLDRNGQEMNVPVTLGTLPPGVAPFFGNGGASGLTVPTNIPQPVGPTAKPGTAVPTGTAAATSTKVAPTATKSATSVATGTAKP